MVKAHDLAEHLPTIAGRQGDCLAMTLPLKRCFAYGCFVALQGNTVTAESTQLTPHQQMLSDLWEEHCRYEFSVGHKSVEKTMETMVEEPYVNHIPTSIGGMGKHMLNHFYDKHFIFSNPEIILKPVSRTVGQNQLVDEMVVLANHTKPIPWLLPGVTPTGKQLEFPLVAIVRFGENMHGLWRLVHEHIYWDQAGVLVQVGLLDPWQLFVGQGHVSCFFLMIW